MIWRIVKLAFLIMCTCVKVREFERGEGGRASICIGHVSVMGKLKGRGRIRETCRRNPQQALVGQSFDASSSNIPSVSGYERIDRVT